jgi:hypothetical protein
LYDAGAVDRAVEVAVTRHCVILADVIDSRDLADRESFGDDLDATLGGVNDTLAESITADFTPLKGIDEFGGVLDSPRRAYDVIQQIVDGLFPVEVRFAVAYDAVDVAPEADVALMDGPAFHRADELLREVESAGDLVGVDTGDPLRDGYLTDVANLILTLRGDWTARQFEVVTTYRETGNQTATADRLGVSQQSVSSALRRSHYGRIARAETHLRRMLAGADPI